MKTKTKSTLVLGSCSFEMSSLALRDASGAVLPLRSQSLQVLGELARTPGVLVPRDQLVEAVWPNIAVTDDSLAQCIKDIRHAISDGDRSILKTVVGRGYVLNARYSTDQLSALPVILIERFSVSDGAAEDLSEALFEELLIRLTTRRGIVVLTDPGRRADAKYVISGHVSERAGMARIFFRIALLSGGDLHAGNEEAHGDALWELPSRVSDTISAQLRIHMLMSDGSEYAQADNATLSTQELLTKATWHMSRFFRSNWQAARVALERAVEMDPENPTALTMLASMETHMIPLIPFSEIDPDAERALALCERAVALDPSIDWVLRTRGNIRMWLRGDHDGARYDCERALKFSPAYHLAHLTIATSDILTGEFAAGVRRLEEMLRRVPFDIQNPLYYSLISLGRLLDGNIKGAIEMGREGHESSPLGAWNALVYAVAIGDDPEVTSTDSYQRMLNRIDLDASHFLHFPFTDVDVAKFLTDRARAAGVPWPAAA